MAAERKLRDPWLLAVWPGMGGVAITAGYYLMSKLGMHLLVEFPATDLFELTEVEVKDGMIQTRQLPRSRIFRWNDPNGRHDIILFIGEAQPPSRGSALCMRLIEFARNLGVGRVFTFAAMATPMRPKHDARVFGAAIDADTFERFGQFNLEMMESGRISGLNGVLLGMAASSGLAGGCLLGEIPMVFSQIPFPRASLNVLQIFAAMARIDLDFTELRVHAGKVDVTLEDFLTRMEQSEGLVADPPEESSDEPQREDPKMPFAGDRRKIERLFELARKDRSQAYTLKQELDRRGLFMEYEDRFLDLFKNPD